MDISSILRTQAAITRLTHENSARRYLDFATAYKYMREGKKLARSGWKVEEMPRCKAIVSVTARQNAENDWYYLFERSNGVTFKEPMLSYNDYTQGDWYVVE